MNPVSQFREIAARIVIYWEFMLPILRTCLSIALVLVCVFPIPVYANDKDAEITNAEQAAEHDLQGLPIVSIVFIRRDIFDTSMPGTTAWPYRLANKLHITSTEMFIRRMLLFSEGDPFNAAELKESARILRSTDLVNPVEITAREVTGGVEVTVDTRDRWTLQVGAKFGISGNRSDFAISVDENHLFGQGWALNLKYASDDERSSWTYGLYHPNILGSRWRARVEYRDASDGYRNLIRADYPFYSLATTKSWGIEWDDNEYVDYLYSLGQPIIEGPTKIESMRLWGGIRLPTSSPRTHRLVFGIVDRSESFGEWSWNDTGDAFAPPGSMKIRGPRIGYEQVADRFLVIQGFRSWVSQEDVALGPNFNLGLTISLPSFGGDIERYIFDGELAMVRSRDNWMFDLKLWTFGRLDEGELRNTVIGGQFVASQVGDRSFMFRLMVEASRDLDSNHQLTLGTDIGLRGWDPDYFDGTGRAVANLQWRVKIKDDIFHLFSLGAVAFVDAGYTWDPRVGPGTERIHSDIGVGLVADVPQIGLVKLLRLEVAYPDDGSGYTVTITTSGLF